MSAFDRRLARVLYYAGNIGRDLAPQALFRARLERILAGAHPDDLPGLAERVLYYNRLPVPTAGATFAADIAHISLDHSYYYYDLKEHLRYFPRGLRLNYLFGDVSHVPPQPSFVKSRPIAGDNRNSVLMKLDKLRHFRIPADPIPFRDKQPRAVWRGIRNNPRRDALVSRYGSHPLCDIGFTNGESPKPFLSPAEQMQSRYIVSVEGFDVATNLKWVLASNALCLMAPPTCETWFMEGRLEPGRHYAALRPDHADLEEKVSHFERHPDEALAIIANANAHVRQFYDAPRERLLSLLVACRYFVATGQLTPSTAYLRLTGGNPS